MKRRILTVAVIAGGIMLMALPAFAAADTAAVSAVDAGATAVKDTLISVATTVLPYAAAILAIVFGWRMAKRFVAGR